MRTVSWILLVVVVVLIVLGSLASASLAYLGGAADDVLAKTNVAELAAGRADVETALRARRGTAAAFALGFAVLLLFVTAGPYRRGEKWAWWAILVSVGVFALATLARMALLGTDLGVSTALILFAATLVGLLLDFKRLSQS